jgi:hypothetical protein
MLIEELFTIATGRNSLPVNGQMKGFNMVYIHNGILLGHQKITKLNL